MIQSKLINLNLFLNKIIHVIILIDLDFYEYISCAASFLLLVIMFFCIGLYVCAYVNYSIHLRCAWNQLMSHTLH